MLYKIISVIIDTLFPLSHLQIYLNNCSWLEFQQKLSPKAQFKSRIFSPFSYKNKFTQDCIFELKERNSRTVAILFGKILAQWAIREIQKIEENNNSLIKNFFIIPVPQHISKTKEKGFCHTTLLANEVCNFVNKKIKNVFVKKCVVKIKYSKKLHNLKGKRNRYKIIQNTMKTYLTKRDSDLSYFFIIDDVYTTGATFKEVHRSLLDCGVLSERIFFISIAH